MARAPTRGFGSSVEPFVRIDSDQTYLLTQIDRILLSHATRRANAAQGQRRRFERASVLSARRLIVAEFVACQNGEQGRLWTVLFAGQ
jgi:hypothetical protein